MKKYVNLQEKSLGFAIKIKYLYKHLINKSEYIISKQVFRSGTSIGANIWEAKFSESRNDLIHKYRISLKETNETLFWFNLLKNTKEIDIEYYDQLYSEGEEILKILITTIKNLKKTS